MTGKIHIYLSLFVILIMRSSLIQGQIVSVDGRALKVDGERYFIKGVCYSPVKKGDDRINGTDLSQIDSDIELMQQACINTIRLYAPVDNVDFYDKMNDAGIKVIVGFPNYDDTQLYSDISTESYLTFINKYKSHPAILFWELGNEYNYHPEWFGNYIDTWYTTLDNAAIAIKNIDPDHPVGTAHGEVPTTAVLGKCPAVDIWGMNVYRWDNPSGAATDFAARSEKACYFSEAGADRFNNSSSGEDQANHAKALANTWKNTETVAHISSGITLFSWVDEWWKAGNVSVHDNGGFVNSIPYDDFANEEWFGLVDIDRNTSKGYDTIASQFCNTIVSVNEVEYNFNAISVFPVPASSKLVVGFDQTLFTGANYQILTIGGQTVLNGLMIEDKTIDISGIETGCYLLKVITPESIYTTKFIKTTK